MRKNAIDKLANGTIMENMSSKCEIGQPNPVKRERIDVAFNEKEKVEYRLFLAKTGRKAGPWVRTLILKAIRDEEEILSEKTQISIKTPLAGKGDRNRE